MRDHYDMQPRLGADRAPGETIDEAVTGGWIRLADPTPSTTWSWRRSPMPGRRRCSAGCAEPLGVPTVDLTIHFRDEPPSGRTGPSSGSARTTPPAGYVEEDGELWSSDGRLLAQSRQLAIALPM